MTATVFLRRFDANLIYTGYLYKLDDFDWHKRTTGWSNFLFGPKQSFLDVARTALAEANMVDK